uniref:HDC14918 n=1 Tax=Drosophila melanogaster TaxID=7227 RepID=Q6IJH0_DROME|nr:TPA_inf: HDC14918 [Drosophila melanogaster]
MHSRTQSVSGVFCLWLHECAFVLCMWSVRHTLRMKMTTSTAARRDFNAVLGLGLGSGYVSVSGYASAFASASGYGQGSSAEFWVLVVLAPSLLSARVHVMPSKRRPKFKPFGLVHIFRFRFLRLSGGKDMRRPACLGPKIVANLYG